MATRLPIDLEMCDLARDFSPGDLFLSACYTVLSNRGYVLTAENFQDVYDLATCEEKQNG